jgi:hypothetical protein
MNNILVHKHLIVRAEAKNPPMDEAVLLMFTRAVNLILK